MAMPKRYVVCEGCQLQSLHHAHGRCRPCSKKHEKRQRKARDPEGFRRKEAEYRDRNRDKIRIQAVESYYRHHEKRKAQGREGMLKRHYGLDFAGRDALLAEQGGCCRICDVKIEKFGRGATEGVVDHNHATGQVRGILCARCNVGLGFVEKIGLRAFAYLEETSGIADK